MSAIIQVPSGFSKKQNPRLSAAKAALGRKTKSATTYRKNDEPETHVLQGLRAERYRLQNEAKRLAFAEGLKAGMEFPANWHRTAKCSHQRVAPTVDVKKSTRNNKAYYSGLAACGSVWACPICTAKIQEQRRSEAAKLIDWAYLNGQRVVMVTLTQPHYYYNDLKELLKNQQKSLRDLRMGNSWQLFKKRCGFKGLVRSLEVTHGDNGWHPHTHELWVIDKDFSYSALLKFVKERWKKISKKHDLIPRGKMPYFDRFSVDIKDNVSTSDYLAKMDDSKHWGGDREIAKAASKATSRIRTGKHPFALLQKSLDGDKKAGALFVEFMDAFKGKRQMFWSHGLKDLVGVNDLTDEELAEMEEEEPEKQFSLDHEMWRVIRKQNAQSYILDLTENSGVNAVDDWLRLYGLHLYQMY